MDNKKQLWVAILIVYGALFTISVSGNQETATMLTMAGILLIVPFFASRYAIRDLGGDSYISWFFLSMIPMVPIVLALEKRSKPREFDSEQLLAGRSPQSYQLGDLEVIFRPKPHLYLSWKILSSILLFPAAPIFLWLFHKFEKKMKSRWVAVFSNGLVSAMVKGKPMITKWLNIHEVWQDFNDQYLNGVRTHHRRRCRIVLDSNDKSMEFTERIKGIEELTATIHERVTRDLVKKMGATFSKQGHLNFGRIELTKQGITLKNQLLPWEDLAGIYMDSGFVVIAKVSLSKGEARLKNAGNRMSAVASRIIGTAQPLSPGGETVIWKKTPINKTPNPYTLTIIAIELLQQTNIQSTVTKAN